MLASNIRYNGNGDFADYAHLAEDLQEQPVATPQAPPLDWESTKQRLHARLLDTIHPEEVNKLPPEQRRRAIKQALLELIDRTRVPLTTSQRRQLLQELLDDVLGLGPLEPLLRDPTISDILVNGPHQVYVERGGVLEETPVRFRDNDHLLEVIYRIVSWVGKRVDESSPIVDARLPDGSRVNAIIPPLSLRGPALSIRRFSVQPFQLADLLRFGTLAPEMAQFLEAAVKARLSLIISGGTGTGKTTLMNVLSGFIPNHERIISVEDAAELQLQQRHVLQLETRPPNIEGTGAVTMRELVRNTLRMRPSRIIIGECRGAEALDMLQAMNTGHEGSMTTLHANSPRDALSRLEMMLLMNRLEAPLRALREQIASAVNLIVQVERSVPGYWGTFERSGGPKVKAEANHFGNSERWPRGQAG
jgi:pilus assembly protein CpaF